MTYDHCAGSYSATRSSQSLIDRTMIFAFLCLLKKLIYRLNL
jgi:hypothetical protein